MQKKNEKRRHYRKNTLIIADYTTLAGRFHGVLTDISAGGLFVRTVNLPVVGQAVALEFSLFCFDDRISVAGTVIRIDSNGFAVRLDEPIETLACPEDDFPQIVSECDR